MKQLGEALGFAVMLATVFGLAFIFSGEPDLYDKWLVILHEDADSRLPQSRS